MKNKFKSSLALSHILTRKNKFKSSLALSHILTRKHNILLPIASVIGFRFNTSSCTLGESWVSLVEQELLTLPEHLGSSPVFNGVRVTRSLVLYVCFGDRCLSFCTFSFGHCLVCSSSIYGFWLPLWYLQALLVSLVSLNTCERRYIKFYVYLSHLKDRFICTWRRISLTSQLLLLSIRKLHEGGFKKNQSPFVRFQPSVTCCVTLVTHPLISRE